ncbi:MAG: VanZ family protein [Nanoarchaeota archaeon]
MKAYQKFSFFCAILTGAIIFYMSSLSIASGSGGFAMLPFLYHFGIFFLLGFFLFLAFNSKKNFYFIIFLICFSYAGLDEIHQLFVPGRACDIFDFFVDSFGIISSFIFLKLENIFK